MRIQGVIRDLATGLVAAVASAAALGQCYYTTTEIPGTQNALPVAINNLGYVVGNAQAGDTLRGFCCAPETGVRYLPLPAGMTQVRTTGLNDLGQVVGYMTSPNGWRGYVWDGQNYTFILPPAWANTIEAKA